MGKRTTSQGKSPLRKKTEELPQVGEYLQCTFKPEIIGKKFNKGILAKKKEAARGVDNAAKRMREAHESREKTKNYMER